MLRLYEWFQAVLTGKLKPYFEEVRNVSVSLGDFMLFFNSLLLLSILFHIEPVNPMIIGSLVTTQHGTPLEGVFTFLLSVIPTSHSSAAP